MWIWARDHLRTEFLWVLLLGIFVARVALTYREFNATADECGHLSCGLELWEGKPRWDLQHPPLAQWVIGLFPHLAGFRTRGDETDEIDVPSIPVFPDPPAGFRTKGDEIGEIDGNWQLLTLARMGNLWFAPILFFYVYRWSSLLYGPNAGLAAVALLSFCPNILAHASLATTDFAAATTIFAAAFEFRRWISNPRLVSCLLCGITLGLALASKFSAFVYLPPVLLLYACLAWRSERMPAPPRRAVAGQGLVLAAIACLVMAAAYRFDLQPSAAESEAQAALGDLVNPNSGVGHAAYFLAHYTRFLPPDLFRGIHRVIRHNKGGHAAYLLGKRSQSGWWYYFPVALILKSSPGLLLILALAIGCLLRGRASGPLRDTLPAVIGAAGILCAAMMSRIDIGIRHVLPIFPFLALIGSSLFARDGPTRKRPIAALAAALLLWHGVDSLAAHPDYLAYFTPFVRGHEAHYLLDSNLDWGQDLARLARYARAHNIDKVHLSYFGFVSPEVLDLGNVVPLAPGDRPAGWIAISLNNLFEVFPECTGYAWLQRHTPYARIGKSIYLYYFASEP